MSPTVPRIGIEITWENEPVRDYAQEAKEGGMVMCFKQNPVSTITISGAAELVSRLWGAVAPALEAIKKEEGW